MNHFILKYVGQGYFQTKNIPRVIWVGIEDSEILMKLKRDIENSMEFLGYQKEDKELNPISRLEGSAPKRELCI